jgi:hypothetical protein
MERRRARVLFGAGIALAGALVIFLMVGWPHGSKSLPNALLADGRILQVEGVTFGTYHRIGFKSPLENIRPWVPGKLYDWLSPRYPHSETRLDRPGLVVWVNATDPTTGKHVDCQGIRVEILGEGGDMFGEDTSCWFGGSAFWRVGHVFYAFPRTQRTLTVQVTPWRTNVSVRLEVPNPQVVQQPVWSRKPLPQERAVGGLEVVMTDLLLRTNGSTSRYWESPARYWLPVWELRQEGRPVSGWEKPEWIAEDPSGNRSRFLGVHQPVLRFSGTFYPSPTNRQAAMLIGSSSPFHPGSLQSNVFWDLRLSYGKATLIALGIFTNGTHLFLEGAYQTNPPAAVRMGPVRGGAPSDWVGTSRRVTPTRVEEWAGHYTPVPTIYVQAKDLPPGERLAVRLRDEQDRLWVAKPEPQGNGQGIHPFLLDLPSDVKTVVAEFVVLRPVEAEFTSNVPPPPPEPLPAPIGGQQIHEGTTLRNAVTILRPAIKASPTQPLSNGNNALGIPEIPVADPSSAQPVTAGMAVNRKKLHPGDAFELCVRARIAGGHHIYGTNAVHGPFSPTALTLRLPREVEAIDDWAVPEPAKTKGGDLVYTESVVFRRHLKIQLSAKPGKLIVSGELFCQPCSEQLCWPPRTIPLSVSVVVQEPKTE